MKIFVVQSYLGGGGAERVGVLLAKGLADKGHRVYLVTNREEERHYAVAENIILLNLVTSQQTKFHKWKSAVSNLRKHLKEYQPDVLIGIMELCSFIAKLSAFGLRIPVVATEHNAFERPVSAPMSLMGKIIKFYLNHIYNAVTVLTEADQRVIGNRLHNVYAMPNPLAIEPVTKIPIKEKVILSAGRLDGWHVKGYDVLIKAWGNLMKNEECRMKNLDWRLQIAGTGSEESLEYLKNLCKENGVENSVNFLGFVSDMESLYKKASVFVLSSRYEGFGLVLIEAMSQGCACIACDYKGRQREIMCPDELELGTSELGTHTGILCPPDDVKALADAMQKMMDDDEYRESVRGNAVERSKYYSIENTIARWEILLNSIVNKK